MKYGNWFAVIGFVAALLAYGSEQRKVGALREQLAHLVRETKRVDTLYKRDTLTLTRVRRITDSVLVTDTVIRVDSVKVLIHSERLACDAVVKTCEQRVAVRDSTIRALKSKSHTVSKVLWFLAGVGTGAVLK
jgi:hypothetical protein